MTIAFKDNPLQLGVVTDNAEAMLNFYQQILGLPQVGEIPFPGLGVVHKLACGGNMIKILVLEKPAAHHHNRDGFAASTGYRYCTLELNNLDETLAHCRANGVKIVMDARQLRPGVRAAMLEDPDGNSIELFEQQA